ncbi:MAG: hypothetical protein ACFFFG_08355 [Candidatus Thorarchaeota archaeon]
MSQFEEAINEQDESTEEEEGDLEDDYIRLFSSKQSFFLEEPYVYLINPDLFPERVSYVKDFKLKEVIRDFYSKLLQEGLDFRILGQAIYSASRIHKKKVSLAIQYEKKQEERIAIRTKRRAFQFKIPLEHYITRDLLALAESANPEAFYAELLLGLQEEEEKKKLERIKEERKKLGEKAGAERQRRKLDLADFESFDYDIDLSRVKIEDIVKETLTTIINLAKQDKNKEAEFSKVVRMMEERGHTEEQKRLTRARVLISLLYLFRDEKITAEQELNPPYEIYISPTRRAED